MAVRTVNTCDVNKCERPAEWLALDDIQQPKWVLCEPCAIDLTEAGKLKRYTLMRKEDYDRSEGQILDSAPADRGQQPGADRARADQTRHGVVRTTERRSQVRRGPDDNRAVAVQPRQADEANRPALRPDVCEQVPATTPTSNPYAGAGQLQLTPEQMQALTAPIDPAKLDIKPTGEVYLPQIEYRRMLNAVIGPGNWALVPLDKPVIQDNMVFVHYALYVYGRFVSDAVGGMAYVPKNPRANWGNCVEGAKSDALSRCCKDLGIASEAWDRSHNWEWCRTHAIRVKVKGYRGVDDQWRKTDGPPLPGEVRHKHEPESEYSKAPRMEDEFNSHIEGIQNER